MQILVKSGDIAHEPADALMTAINTGGLWFGGIDRVIQNAAGNQYHAQASERLQQRDTRAFVASQRTQHSGAFRDVLFIFDDLKTPLSDVICAGLIAAGAAGLTTLSMPAIRLGVMRGIVEKSITEAANEFKRGFLRFRMTYPDTPIQTVTIVVYNDPEVLSALRAILT